MNKRIPLILVLLLLFCPRVWAAVDIVDDSAGNYVINHFSQAFSSIRDKRVFVEPDNYNVRMVGEPVDSWSYSDGKDLFFLGQDSWVLSKSYFTMIPQRCGIILKDLSTGEEYWFLTVFLSKKSKENWERITDPNCPGGGDPALVFPMAPAGYFGCSNLDNDGDGWTGDDGDYDDGNNFIYPEAIEICGDGIDQDCNGFDLQCEENNSSVTLSWSKPDDSRVVGYKIYCGISGTDFKTTPVQTIDTVDQTSCLIPNLEVGSEYSFAATSFDADGNESDFSETICYTIPFQSDSDNDGDGWTVAEGDCNDNNADVYPGAIEICGDGVDQDCDGKDMIFPSMQCVTISEEDDYYLIKNLSSAFAVFRDQGILINPDRYNIRMIGEPVNSWSYSDGRDLVYLGEDSWALSKDYLSVDPKKIGIIVKDRETLQEYWFITAFLCDDSKEKFERTTDPSCPYGGGDISLILPQAPAGYFPCN